MDYTAPVQKNAGIVMTKSQLANYFVKTLPLPPKGHISPSRAGLPT